MKNSEKKIKSLKKVSSLRMIDKISVPILMMISAMILTGSFTAWALSYFDSTENAQKLELRVDGIDLRQREILDRLGRIETKVDILLNKKL